MSASQWRRAMNSAATTAAHTAALPARAAKPASPPADAGPSPLWSERIGIRPRHLVVLVAVLVYPFVASPFFTYQIGAQSLALGLIALSLTFLGGYGGMVSLAQMSIAGFAGYGIAIFGTSSFPAISLGWPWWLAAGFSIVAATVFAAVVGWLSVRTEGIYTIMITLAIGVAFF
jgi:branched-chain amino acid transport system permease protein